MYIAISILLKVFNIKKSIRVFSMDRIDHILIFEPNILGSARLWTKTITSLTFPLRWSTVFSESQYVKWPVHWVMHHCKSSLVSISYLALNIQNHIQQIISFKWFLLNIFECPLIICHHRLLISIFIGLLKLLLILLQ